VRIVRWVHGSSKALNGQLILDRTAEFPYCGLLVDTETLDLRIDITRSYGLRGSASSTCGEPRLVVFLHHSTDVQESLTIKSTAKQGAAFASWLKRWVDGEIDPGCNVL
jgi:hypothetical protein